MIRRANLVACVTAGLVTATTGGAYAYWELTAQGEGRSTADALRTNDAPSLAHGADARSAVATVARSASVAGRATGVEMLHYAAATGGSSDRTVACAATSDTVAACTDAALPEGRHHYSARQTAGTAWRGPESARTSLLIDTTAPLVTPAAGTTGWSSQPVTSTATAQDASTAAEVSGVQSLSWSAAGATTGSGSATITPSTSPATVHSGTGPTVTADGTTTVTWTATDAHGNALSSQQVVRVDRTAPSGSISAPSPGAVVSGTVTVTGTAQDATSGLAASSVQVRQDGASAWTDLGNTGTTASPSASWSTSGLSGTYHLRVLATDAAGNNVTATSSPSVSVQVGPTGFRGTAVTTENGSAAGKIDTLDAVVLTFSEAVKPESISAGWTGAVPLNRTVTITNGASGARDVLTVGNSNVGTVDLSSGAFVTATQTLPGSTLALSADRRTLTITLACATNNNGNNCINDAQAVTTQTALVWTPSSSVQNASGTAVSTAPVTQSPAKVNF